MRASDEQETRRSKRERERERETRKKDGKKREITEMKWMLRH